MNQVLLVSVDLAADFATLGLLPLSGRLWLAVLARKKVSDRD
jgi:hypothetical protein